MFDWFKNKDKEQTNVVQFPELKKSPPPMPEVSPPKDPAGRAHYKLGLTDNNRVIFQMGYNEISMNKYGCQQMIDQLTFYMDRLHDEEDVEE